MRRSALIVLLSLCTLGACAQHEAGVTEPAPPAATTPAAPVAPATPAPATPPGDAMAQQCKADSAQSFVGRVADDATVAAARAAAGAGAVRVIKPGQAITMDYSDSRLNVNVDAQNKIVKLSCG